MAVLANTSNTVTVVADGPQGQPGAGFFRIERLGLTKPNADTTPEPTEMEFVLVAQRDPILGDIAVITYTNSNSRGEFSCAFQRALSDDMIPVPEWQLAGEFIDGNLIVAGSVFSTVSLAVGIPNIDDALVWDPATAVPTIDPMWEGSGAFMGFADREGMANVVDPPLPDQQEILLVGGQEDHIFFDGENLTLSGVTIEDPTILVTPTAPVLNTGNPVQVGDVVSFNDRIYRAIANQPMTPTTPPPDDTLWEDITEDIPRGPVVTVATAAPASAEQGDLWYDETIGRMFMFINATDPVSMNVIGTWADVTKN